MSENLYQTIHDYQEYLEHGEPDGCWWCGSLGHDSESCPQQRSTMEDWPGEFSRNSSGISVIEFRF